MGIDLQAKSVSDAQKIHNGTLGTGGFNVSLKFTDLVQPVANSLTIQGLFNDTSIVINPDNGLPMTGSKIGISFTQEDLTIWDGLADLQRWQIEFTNGAGQLINCEIDNVNPDRSYGSVEVTCKVISGHV
jgi:hypothetical protein